MKPLFSMHSVHRTDSTITSSVHSVHSVHCTDLTLTNHDACYNSYGPGESQRVEGQLGKELVCLQLLGQETSVCAYIFSP
jgi:hypothetical protein